MTAPSHAALAAPAEWGVGTEVVALVPLLQDGSFPDPEVRRGQVLVPAGTAGHVVDVGSYLQRHTVYAVAFENGRLLGCLAEELAVPALPEGSP
jgi:nitrogen fixation protein NifZ